MDARTETERLGRDEAERNEDQGQGWPRWLIPLAVLAALVVIGGGIWYWFSTRGIVSTDDARIAGNATQVAPQVTGRVVAILFADNQHVTEGQKLVELDPRDLEARLDQALAQQASAQSQLTQAEAQVQSRQADLDQAQANVAVAQADLTQARKDYERFQHLNPAAVTQQQRDQVDAAYRADTAKLAAANQAVEGARAQIGVAKAAVAAAQAGVKQAEATVEQARLQLSYATITAPVTGRVTHRTVNVGDVVQAGQPLFALVQDKLWVQADFKETALAGMKPGQKVAISVDAVPGVTFRGRVDSFQDGTGAQFSALPAENATGNWVKIVQRVPVKIVFEGDDYRKYFLAPGMSAEPTVTLR
ncbi:MAG TPA: HlyD family secretion protein [Acetobacteraceae bacterium]|nr:HlyD family secretion protein [Acetobacteraceae bacterium]